MNLAKVRRASAQQKRAAKKIGLRKAKLQNPRGILSVERNKKTAAAKHLLYSKSLSEKIYLSRTRRRGGGNDHQIRMQNQYEDFIRGLADYTNVSFEIIKAAVSAVAPDPNPSATPQTIESDRPHRQIKTAARLTTQQKPSSKPKKAPELPALPTGLAWPTETYSQANSKRGENIVQFLERVWMPLIKAGFNELRWLRIVDPSAASGVNNFERFDRAAHERKRLPEQVRFLTKKESKDRRLLVLKALTEEPQLVGTVLSTIGKALPHPHN